MPGGYGDDTSLPWTGFGDTGASWNIPSSNTSNGGNGGGWSPGVGRDESGYLPTSPHYSGNLMEDTNENVVLSSDNLINQDVTPQTQEELQAIQDDKVWEAATQAYLSNPGYALSFEGKKYSDKLEELNIMKGSEEYQKAMIQAFGMPNIVMTSGRTGEPLRSEETGDYLYSGQGKYVLDKGDITTPEGYEQAKGEYWKTRTEQEQFEEQQRQQQTGYGYNPGGGGYGGGSMAGVHPRSFYKGLPYQDFSGKEVHKMLDFDQKVEAANILSGLSQGAQAFAMDPKQRGILAVLQA